MKTQTRSKILVQVWTPLVMNLNKHMDRIPLKRDAYLDSLIRSEIAMMDVELPEANSEEAKAYIKQGLQRLDRKQVSLTLSPDTIAILDDICECKKVLRDSFINHLFFFLVLGPKVINALYPWFKGCIEPLGERIGNEMLGVHTYGLDAAASALRDPFEFYRECVNYVAKEDGDGAPAKTFYQLQIPIERFEQTEKFKREASNLHGLNCFMPDYLVPDTSAYQESKKLADDFLKEFDEFSSLLPSTPDTTGATDIEEE